MSDTLAVLEKNPEILKEAEERLNNKKIICLKDIEPQEVKWIWKPYIPCKLCIINGDPGNGKTFVSLKIASIISNGQQFPNENTENQDGNIEGFIWRDPAKVIYQTAEDGLADTVIPRLISLGANLENIYVIDEDEASLTATDVRLEEVLKEYRPKVVFLDPIQAYIGRDIDMNKANEVRPVLKHLGRLAEQYECAIILVGHLNKAGQSKSIYKSLGSIDIPAAARSILMIGNDPNNPQNRAIAHVKSSLAPKGDSIGFELHPETGFKWTGVSMLTDDDMLAPAKGGNSKDTFEEAQDFLRELLKDGPVLANDVYDHADQAGITRHMLMKAKDKLKIESNKDEFHGKWHWRLKKHTTYKNKIFDIFGQSNQEETDSS